MISIQPNIATENWTESHFNRPNKQIQIYGHMLENWTNAHFNQPNNQIQINKASTHYKQPYIYNCLKVFKTSYI